MAYGIDTVEALAKVDVKDYPMAKNVSGVSFKARHLDPNSARGHACMDKASEIVIRVGHNASYAFDGLANAAFLHEVANAENPIPGLYRITHVSFMQAN